MNFWKTAALCLALMAPAAEAQELSANARTALTERVEAFSASVAEGDMGAAFDFMPPRLLTAFADLSSVDVPTFVEMGKAQMETVMASATINSFSMDADAATYQMTPDGSLGYVLIPTETVMTIEGAGKMKSTAETLAFEDEGEWYLARTDNPSLVTLLQTVYPAFEGVTFKSEITEPVVE
ncbi:hypothetical protein [Tabrizicola sp.]|uniref:hypothetical protein n=1 Tax=Tabrizicola sp. TaxID=2005166 RepID=UPI003F351421